MIKCILTVGGIACGKSTWAREEVRKDPEGTARINRDDLRNMVNGYVFSDSNERLITKISNAALVAALKSGRNVIMDETNLNRRNFDEVCKTVKSLNIDCMIMEKSFYVDLDVALERNSKREGTARIPDDVVEKFYKKAGGKQHAFYKPRVEMFYKNGSSADEKLVQNENAPKAIISDLDGTLALFEGKRSPYDAKDCDLIDEPNPPVLETIKLFYANNYKIIFCSGREDKFEPETRRFIEHNLPNVNYDLFMRKTADSRKDNIIKEEIFNEHIKEKYNILFVLDDRDQVVEFWRSIGLTCFQVAPGNF